MTTEEFKLQAVSLRDRLMDVARQYLGDSDEAEDIVQDAMLKLWLMRADLRAPLSGIGSVVTRNLCIDCLRKRMKTIDIAQLREEDIPEDKGEEIEQMLKIIDTLPSTQRTILKMRHLQGMAMSEIAQVMGATEPAVRQILSRARKSVRRKLIAWLAAACLIGVITIVTVRWLRIERGEECVAYIYGKKHTDEETVMIEMKRAMGDIVADDPQDEIERQLNELFSE